MAPYSSAAPDANAGLHALAMFSRQSRRLDTEKGHAYMPCL